MSMPIRGALFTRFKKFQAKRHELERKKSVVRRQRETKELQKLVGKRKRAESEAALLTAIAREKSRIKAAKKPGKIGKFAKKLEMAALKEAKKRRPKIKVTFNPSGTKRKKRRKKGRR